MNISKTFSIFKKVDSAIVVSLDFDITLLNVKFKSDLPKVKALKVVKFESASKDQDVLDALTTFVKENNIQHNNVILVTSFNLLTIKRLQLPAVPSKELLEAIKWQIKDDIPFDLSKAVLDFSIIKKITKSDGAKTLDIICAIKQEDEIKQQAHFLKKSGFRCLSAIPLPFGYLNLVARHPNGGGEEAKGFLYLSENNCFFAIYKNRKLEFYRELPVSIGRLRKSLKDMLISDRGKLELSDDEANEVLFEVGLPTEDLVYKEKISSVQIRSMLSPILERLGQEIKRSLAYYQSQFDENKVKDIFIGGEASVIPNIDKFLSNEFFLNVYNLSLSDKIDVQNGVDLKMLKQRYGYLGLATNFSENINLLPYEFRTEKIEEVEKISLRWVGLIIFLILILLYTFTKVRITGYQERLDNALLHLNVISEVRQTKTRIDELSNFITESKSSTLSVSKVLKALSFISDEKLFITNLSLDSNSKTGIIIGYVKVKENDPQTILTQFIRRAENLKYFANLSISSVTKKIEAGYDIAEFNITFMMN
ncbi:MAG: pilus assembly protein PilM [Candidatus Susulua stagnicola]|nr:pilus assembly protein PilM [Candidatus Susulua stagnicola]